MPSNFGAADLRAIMADATGFGDDVYFGARKFRGILTTENRFQDDGGGVQVQVMVTTLTVQAEKLPSGIITDSVLTIADVRYKMRRKGPVMSDGSQELLLVEA